MSEDEEKKERKARRSSNLGHSIRRRNRIRQIRDDEESGVKKLPMKKEERLHFRCMMCRVGFRKTKPSDSEMCPPCLKAFRKMRGR